MNKDLFNKCKKIESIFVKDNQVEFDLIVMELSLNKALKTRGQTQQCIDYLEEKGITVLHKEKLDQVYPIPVVVPKPKIEKTKNVKVSKPKAKKYANRENWSIYPMFEGEDFCNLDKTNKDILYKGHTIIKTLVKDKTVDLVDMVKVLSTNHHTSTKSSALKCINYLETNHFTVLNKDQIDTFYPNNKHISHKRPTNPKPRVRTSNNLSKRPLTLNKDLLKRCKSLENKFVKYNKVDLNDILDNVRDNQRFRRPEAIKLFIKYFEDKGITVNNKEVLETYDFTVVPTIKRTNKQLDMKCRNILKNYVENDTIDFYTICDLVCTNHDFRTANYIQYIINFLEESDVTVTNKELLSSTDIKQYQPRPIAKIAKPSVKKSNTKYTNPMDNPLFREKREQYELNRPISKNLKSRCENISKQATNLELKDLYELLKTNKAFDTDLAHIKAIRYLTNYTPMVLLDNGKLITDNFTKKEYDYLEYVKKKALDKSIGAININKLDLTRIRERRLNAARYYFVENGLMDVQELIAKNSDYFSDEDSETYEDFEDEGIIKDQYDELDAIREAAEQDKLVNGDASLVMNNDSVRGYFLSIKNYELLTAEQEKEYAVKVQQGDKHAREILINHNLRLVVAIAKKYLNYNLPFMDLIQYGNMGLMTAVDRFDPSLNYRFSTYATWWIRQAILRGVENDARLVRMPVHAVEQANRIKRAKIELANAIGRDPSEEELVDYVNKKGYLVSNASKLTIETLHRINAFYDLTAITSLDVPVGQDDDADSVLGDFIASDTVSPEDLIVKSKCQADVRSALQMVLTHREQTVIMLRFGLKDGKFRTLEQVAKVFNVTRERIRQIEAKALRKLRNKPQSSRLLRAYLT